MTTAPARMKHSGTRAFTLVEILVAMAVLAIGLSSIVAIVMRSARFAELASEQSMATVFLNEAIAGIEQAHLLPTTGTTFSTVNSPLSDPLSEASSVDPLPMPLPEASRGLLITTLQPGLVAAPTIHDYTDASGGYGQKVAYTITEGASTRYVPLANSIKAPFISGDATWAANNMSVAMWPPPAVSGRHLRAYGGPVVGTSEDITSGVALRAIYRLEPHPEWMWPGVGTDDTSRYAGVYVLTIAIYKDISRTGQNLAQLTDPVVVYLRDKKERL